MPPPDPKVGTFTSAIMRKVRPALPRGRMGWQKATGYNARAKAEAAVSRYKRVIGHALRSRTDDRQVTEGMLELGRPKSVRIA